MQLLEAGRRIHRFHLCGHGVERRNELRVGRLAREEVREHLVHACPQRAHLVEVGADFGRRRDHRGGVLVVLRARARRERGCQEGRKEKR